MAIITPSLLDFAYITYDLLFQQAFGEAEYYLDKYASKLEIGTGDSVRMPFTDVLPLMREWIGDRQVHSLMARAQEIKMKDFEVTIGLDRNKLLDDQLGLFSPAVLDFGMSVRQYPERLAVALLEAGESTDGYDDVPFFSASHPISIENSGLGVQSNLFDYALTSENFSLVKAKMRRFLTRNNTPFGILPNTLMVPAELERTALEICQASIIGQQVTMTGPTYGAAAVQNVLMGTVNLVVNPWLTDPNAWYLLCTNRGIKPMMFVERQAPQFVFLNRPDDLPNFMRKEFVFGTDARGNVGFGPWFLAAKSNPS